jgi:hypothetical protein
MNNTRSLVLALLLVLLSGFAWATRYEARNCTYNGCTLLNRWTGDVIYQRAELRR